MKSVKKRVRLAPFDPQTFGARLHAFREQAGMSMRDLAFPGCSPSYISRLETGARLPSLQLVVALADRLGITGLELLGIEDAHCPLCGECR